MTYSPHVVFQQDGAPSHIGLVLSENVLTCFFLGAGLGVIDQSRGLHAHPILRRLSSPCGGYVKDIVYTTPVTSLDEMKLKIFAAMETVTTQMLENT
jgi:hypothetical protein